MLISCVGQSPAERVGGHTKATEGKTAPLSSRFALGGGCAPGEAQEERATLCCHPSYGYAQQHTLTGLTGPLPAAGSAQLPLFRLLQ